jgi:hypothetical protein
MPDPLYSSRYTQAFAITASNQVIAGPTREDGNPTPYCSAFQALTSGNVTAIFKEDHANGSQTFPVVAGIVYPYSLAFFLPGSTATIMGLL